MKKITTIKLFGFVAFAILFSWEAKAQYNITLQIAGSEDSVMYLGRYYLNGTYALDTAQSKKGKFVFKNPKRVFEDGIYFFSNPSGKYFEFIMDKDQDFTLLTNQKNWTQYMKVKGSDCNARYFAYMQASSALEKQMKEISIQKSSMDKAVFDSKAAQLRVQNDSLKIAYIKNNPQDLLSKVFEATKSIDVPQSKVIYKADGVSKDSLAIQRAEYDWYLHHYFDNMDLSCSGLLFTPKGVFYDYYNRYWDEQLKYQTIDSIFALASYWIDKTQNNPLMFRYWLHDITERYLQSPYMGQDEIYVKLIDKYFATGKAIWMSPTDVEKEVVRAEKWSHSSLKKQVPDLICPDKSGIMQSLYAMRSKYKILIFWAYDCGHCAVEVPKFYKFYKENKDKYDLSVMAVNSAPDTIQWQESIKKHGFEQDDRWFNVNGLIANYDWHEYFDLDVTPVIFILDSDNRIIGKKVKGDNIEKYLELYDQGKIKF
jgi:AhpC/TSA family.